MDNKLLEAIQIIIKKSSPEAVRQALETKKAFENKAPETQARYDVLLERVFSEGVVFTLAEKEILANALSVEGDGKSVSLNLRLTVPEKTQLMVEAENLGYKSLSDYARYKLFAK